MNLYKFSPVVRTLLAFLLAQGIGTILLIVAGLMTIPDLSIDFYSPLFSPIMMAVDIVAILACRLLQPDIRFVKASDIAAIKWRPGMLAIAGGLLGAMCISTLTDKVKLPDIMQEMSLAMSHNLWGLLTLVIVGPVTEEILFREAIEGGMLRKGVSPWTAITVSALAFSIAHLNLAQGLYAFPIGIIFGIIYYRSRSIVLTALLHILNNGIVAAQTLILGEEATEITYEEWLGSTTKVYAIMLLTGLLCVILMRKFWHSYPFELETDEKQPFEAL